MDKTITLPFTTVDPKSPIPLYYQIYLDLRRIIQQEEIIQPGGMIPPEIEICQAYNVGRQTVRQAIARLVDENVLERFAGQGNLRSPSHQPNPILFRPQFQPADAGAGSGTKVRSFMRRNRHG